jgi:hypothetical protein
MKPYKEHIGIKTLIPLDIPDEGEICHLPAGTEGGIAEVCEWKGEYAYWVDFDEYGVDTFLKHEDIAPLH